MGQLPSESLYVMRTGHKMHDKLANISGRHLDSRTIKQLNEQMTTAVLNIDRCNNT